MTVWRFHVDEQRYAETRQLYITRSEGGGWGRGPATRAVVTQIHLRRLEDGQAGSANDALFTDTWPDREDNNSEITNFLQAALDCAWLLGMRPAGYEDKRQEMVGELSATKLHLADMRKIAKVPGA